jgi:ABC-type enterochelin transport system permease subunit
MQSQVAVAAACTCLFNANSSDQLWSPAILGLVAFLELLQDSQQVNVISSINLQQQQYHFQWRTLLCSCLQDADT